MNEPVHIFAWPFRRNKFAHRNEHSIYGAPRITLPFSFTRWMPEGSEEGIRLLAERRRHLSEAYTRFLLPYATRWPKRCPSYTSIIMFVGERRRVSLKLGRYFKSLLASSWMGSKSGGEQRGFQGKAIRKKLIRKRSCIGNVVHEEPISRRIIVLKKLREKYRSRVVKTHLTSRKKKPWSFTTVPAPRSKGQVHRVVCWP